MYVYSKARSLRANRLTEREKERRERETGKGKPREIATECDEEGQASAIHGGRISWRERTA